MSADTKPKAPARRRRNPAPKAPAEPAETPQKGVFVSIEYAEDGNPKVGVHPIDVGILEIEKILEMGYALAKRDLAVG